MGAWVGGRAGGRVSECVCVVCVYRIFVHT